MLKRFELRWIRSLACIGIFSLTGCGHSAASTDVADDETLISITVSQGEYSELILEDLVFRDLLNSPDVLDEENAPAPEVWHEYNYGREQVISVSVDNCAQLDLLELVIYQELDSRGRPEVHQYVSLCGPEVREPCDTSTTLPSEAQRSLSDSSVEHFAFTGICISEDRLNARSFIGFLAKS